MQLRVARLCLDCEEVHAELRCPVCASDSFAYLSRWVPVEERRHERRPAPVSPPPAPRSRSSRWIAGGAFGLAAIAAGRFLWHTGKTEGGGTADRGTTETKEPS